MLKCICVLIDVNRHTHKNKDQYISWKNSQLITQNVCDKARDWSIDGDAWLCTFSTTFICNIRSHMCVRNVEEQVICHIQKAL